MEQEKLKHFTIPALLKSSFLKPILKSNLFWINHWTDSKLKLLGYQILKNMFVPLITFIEDISLYSKIDPNSQHIIK